MKPAQKRGATTRDIGSTAIISIADNCSVVFISPISAVIAEPARLANSSPEATGPRRMQFYSADHGGKLNHHDVAFMEVPSLPAPNPDGTLVSAIGHIAIALPDQIGRAHV